MSYDGNAATMALQRLADRARTAEAGSDAFLVESAGETHAFAFFGLSPHGEPCLIVLASPSQTPPPPIRLAGISVDHGIQAVLTEGTNDLAVRVSVVRCTSAEELSIEVFAALCTGFVQRFASRPTEQELSDEIARWSGMFWRLAQPVETDVVGLAGELITISSDNDVDRWVRAWHRTPNELIDFEFVEWGLAVEVKATRGRMRRHQISLSQLDVPDGERRYFASVLLEFGDGGTPLGDLVRELLDRLSDDELRVMLWDILARTCGKGLGDVLSRRVHLAKATESVAFFESADVPTPIVSRPLPDGVSSVKFTADLESAQRCANPFLPRSSS